MSTSYSLSPASRTASEAAGTLSFTVTRSGDLPSETLYVSTVQSEGYSNSGDYVGLSNQTLSFSSGQTSKTVTVSITNDSVAEPDETFRLIVQRNASDPVSTFLAKATFTIDDDDAVAPTTYSVSPGSTTVDENAGTVSFTVTRSGGLPAETIYASTAQTEGFSNSGDYKGLNGLGVSFSSGQTSKTVTVSITNDTTSEGNETFGLVIQRHADDGLSTYLTKATFTIRDNDTVAPSTYSLSPTGSTFNEAAGTITFTVSRTGGLAAETVYVSTTQTEGFSNSGDYVGLNGQALAFTSGQSSKTVTVSVTNDAASEASETFGIVVQRNASDPASTFLTKTTFTILDNDAAGPSTYVITPASPTVDEVAGSLTFTVTRGGALGAETVFVSTTQSEGFSNGGDYVGLSSQGLSFSDGQASRTVTVSITNDTAAEATETFGLIVQRNAADPTSVSLARTTFSIRDNDAGAPVVSSSKDLNPLVYSRPHVAHTADDIVGIARDLIGTYWGDVNCTGLVWAVSYEAGRPFFDPDTGHLRPDGHHVDDARYSDQEYVVPGGPHSLVDPENDGWDLVPSGADWQAVARKGDLVRVHYDGGAVHSFVVTDIRGGKFYVIDNTMDPDHPQDLALDYVRVSEHAFATNPGSFGAGVLNPDRSYVFRFHEDGGSLAVSTASPTTGVVSGSAIQRLLSVGNPFEADSSLVARAEGSTVVVNHAATGNVLVRAVQFLELQFNGAGASDKLKLMPLAGTDVANHTIYFNGLGGDDQLDGISADKAIVASGGDGADTLIGGSQGDALDGGSGDDRLAGGPSSVASGDRDVVYGGEGNDTLEGGGAQNFLRGDAGDDVITGGAGFDDIHGNMGQDTESGGFSDDWVVGGKDNDALSGDAGADLVYGNIGSDTCDGGEGADIVRGGQDDDIVRGGGGNDFVSGDKGNDTVTGGAGADLFHTFGDAGLDRVTDFRVSEGDRVMLDPGTRYAVAQVGADTVISMTGGGQMVLVGVSMSSLTEGWIFGA